MAGHAPRRAASATAAPLPALPTALPPSARSLAASMRAQARRALSLPAAVLVLAGLLVVYNNLAYLSPDAAFPPPWLLYPRALLLPALAVGAAWLLGLSLRQAGLSVGRAPRSLAAGVGAGGIAAAPIIVTLLAVWLVAGDALSFSNVESKRDELGDAVYWALILYPLHTVVFEELLFRGVLQGMATRAFGMSRALVLSGAAFALWHVVVNHRVLGKAEVSEDPLLFIAFQAVALPALAAGGLALGLLRERFGDVFAPIGAHWAFLVAIAATVFVLG